MPIFDELLTHKPYSLERREKNSLLVPLMRQMSQHHYDDCFAYRRILDGLGVKIDSIDLLETIPFLPVRLFKEYLLRSVEGDSVVKTMTSSGTSGQQVSKIYLDRDGVAKQSKVLSRIVSNAIGSARRPMIVLDTSSVVANRSEFSARGAGIRGFSIFGRDTVFAFDEEMQLNRAALDEFQARHADAELFLFGFTFMVWKHFYKVLRDTGYQIDLSKSILIHGGGWKGLTNEAVTPQRFRESLHEVCGIRPENVRDYYGMVEQTGTIHMECEAGHLHTSIYGDVIIRRHTDFQPVEPGEVGIIQVLSTLPWSYPGHSLLTEDEGRFLGEDDCPCGRKGKYFHVLGRLSNAETRGCSDTYASQFS